MNKILITLLFPLMIRAQNAAVKGSQTTKDSINEKISPAADTSQMDAYHRIESYRQRVINGEDMSTLARLYSEDPGSAKKGGIYLNVRRGTFVPEFEAIAFTIPVGDISEIFKTQFGYHFLQVMDRHGDAVDCRHILVSSK